MFRVASEWIEHQLRVCTARPPPPSPLAHVFVCRVLKPQIILPDLTHHVHSISIFFFFFFVLNIKFKFFLQISKTYV